MTTGKSSSGIIRMRDATATGVAPVELFFDLVFVLAVTKLTHHLVDHLTARGALETLILLLAVWACWIHVTWGTSYFELDARPIRLALIGAMLGSFVLSITIPDAFGHRGLPFAAALFAIFIGWSLVMRVLVRRNDRLRIIFDRILVWESIVCVMFLIGAALEGDGRLALWSAAVAITYIAMWVGFPVPGLGRSLPQEYTITGGHMAHRCYLFIIIALGESIITSGSTMSQLPGEPATIGAFVVAFAGTVALWWIYFDRTEEDGFRAIDDAGEPGRLGLTAYTYFHIPMIAGIIGIAASDEITIAHPAASATIATAALIIGGPALFITGNLLFTWAVRETVPRSRLVTIAALWAIAPLAFVSSTLVLGAVATLILVGLVVWDLASEAQSAERVRLPGGNATASPRQ